MILPMLKGLIKISGNYGHVLHLTMKSVSQPLRHQTDVFNICLISLPAFKEYLKREQTVKTELEKFVWMFAYGGEDSTLPLWTAESSFDLILKTMRMGNLNENEYQRYHQEICKAMDENDRMLTREREGEKSGELKGRAGA
jgi:hypothetical protein